jgi:hypothetical protein
MDLITIITPPDKLYNDSKSLLLITPSNSIKLQLQTFLSECPDEMNVYLYDQDNDDIEWLLSVMKASDCVIFDIDNSGQTLRNLSGFIVSQKNVFYLTKDSETPYNMLSKNRVYDLSWLYTYFNGEK